MENMSRNKLREFVIIMVTIMIMGLSESCVESERNALLEIKSSFNPNSPYLSSWGSSSDDCCYWENVECNSTTGHITTLFLDFIRDVDSEENWYLNASLFLPFQQLNLLTLNGNNIAGCIHNQGFERLSALANWEILDLSYNKFNNTILRSFSGLHSMKSLFLRENKLKGTIDISVWSNITSALEELDFSCNEIEGLERMEVKFSSLKTLNLGYNNLSAPFNFKGILNKLEYLDLGGNGLNSSVFPFVSEISSLKTLHFENNNLEGPLNFKELDGFTNLQELYLSGNKITNVDIASKGFIKLDLLDLSYNQFNETATTDFFRSIGRITSLITLWLEEFGLGGGVRANTQGLCKLKQLEKLVIEGNDLNGHLPPCLGNMTSLQSLDISSNRLRIPISLYPYFNLSKLTSLDVSNNAIYEDSEDHNLIPRFQLESLDMGGYGEGGEIPKFLYHQHNLEFVEISSMKLRGPIQLPNRPHANLTELDISDNFFNGSIPSKIGILFPNLESLAMSGNELKGSIPDSLYNMSALIVLNLSNNNVSGILPSNISLSKLMYINLSKNKLQGSLKDAFYFFRQLYQLDLSHNNFSGTIPSWIGEISYLKFLVLGHNNLQGKIPIELCNLENLRFLDLSHNNITGHMIPCLNLSIGNLIVKIMDMEMTMKGRTYMYQPQVLLYVSGIDISGNNMTGNIPSEIGNLIGIQTLNFSQNFFTDEIPSTFSNLKEIESLDLSLNNLQGMIPPQLTQLTYLAAFNVSYNNLSGPIPNTVKQFGTFNESSYKGNPFLCGLPLSKSCSSADSPPPNARILLNNDNNRYRFIDMEDFFVSFGISYGTVLLTLATIMYINQYWRRVWFYYVRMSIDRTYYLIIDNVIPLISKF